MWDASCLGCIMHLSLLQGPPGNVILVPAVPTGGRDISWGPGACHCSCWLSFPPDHGKTLKETGHGPYVKTFLEAAETSHCILLLSQRLEFGASL